MNENIEYTATVTFLVSAIVFFTLGWWARGSKHYGLKERAGEKTK